MLTAEKASELRTIAKSIVDVPVGTLISRPAQWGSLSFAPAEKDLALIHDLSGTILSLPIEILPPTVGDAIAAPTGAQSKIPKCCSLLPTISKWAPKRDLESMSAVFPHTDMGLPFSKI